MPQTLESGGANQIPLLPPQFTVTYNTDQCIQSNYVFRRPRDRMLSGYIFGDDDEERHPYLPISI